MPAQPKIVIKPSLALAGDCALCGAPTRSVSGLNLYLEDTYDEVCEECALREEPVLGMVHNQLQFVPWLTFDASDTPVADEEVNEALRIAVGLATAWHHGSFSDDWLTMISDALDVTPAVMYAAFAQIVELELIALEHVGVRAEQVLRNLGELFATNYDDE